MRASKYSLALALFAAVAMGAASAQDQAAVAFEAEFGAVKVLSHSYRVGAQPANSSFDFVGQGGQEILFPFQRYSAILTLARDHQIRFLYQPLEIATQTVFRQAIVVDGTTFPAGTPVEMKYGFPFYRITYQYRFLGTGLSWLAGGAALQARNASIRFASADGTKLATSQNLGLVPALALSGRLALGGGAYASFDAVGIYASSAIINGANFSFEGSLLDASLRLGTAFRDLGDVFLNARFLGGTAAGVSSYPRTEWSNSLSPETENRLATVALTLGATLR